ncbi:MAG: ABC transporter permease [Thermoprotei archaeon]
MVSWKEYVKRFLRYKVAIVEPTQPAVSEASVTGIRYYYTFLKKDKPALVSLGIIGLFTLWALIEGSFQLAAYVLHSRTLGIMLLPSNPFTLSFSNSLKPPTMYRFPVYIFGANVEGQSILSRLLYAAPRDAFAAYIVVASAVVIGMFVGISAGYKGGWADELLMRITDAFLAFPGLVLAIALSILIGTGFDAVLGALLVIWWPTYARFFRGQALALKGRAYVDASKLSGVGTFKIMVRHIFPNAIDPIIAIASLDFGNVILTYSSLAFIGLGVQPPLPEWGAMSSDGLAYFPQNWWWTIIPGLTIMLVVVCFTLIGDRMQDLIGGRATY